MEKHQIQKLSYELETQIEELKTIKNDCPVHFFIQERLSILERHMSKTSDYVNLLMEEM